MKLSKKLSSIFFVTTLIFSLPIIVSAAEPPASVTEPTFEVHYVSEIFKKEPRSYGLRGDSGLWDALQEHFSSELIDPISTTPTWFESELKSQICTTLGIKELSLENKEKNIYVKEFDYKGMSGGVVSLSWWITKGVPLLTDRYKTLYESLFPGIPEKDDTSETFKRTSEFGSVCAPMSCTVERPTIVVIPKVLVKLPGGTAAWMRLFGKSKIGHQVKIGDNFYIVPYLYSPNVGHSKFYNGYRYNGLTDDNLYVLRAALMTLKDTDNPLDWIQCSDPASSTIQCSRYTTTLLDYTSLFSTCAEDIAANLGLV